MYLQSLCSYSNMGGRVRMIPVSSQICSPGIHSHEQPKRDPVSNKIESDVQHPRLTQSPRVQCHVYKHVHIHKC